jgi:hypothetical protein
MNPMQAPNVGPGGKDFGNRAKKSPCLSHDWWLHNIDLWRCAACGGFVRSPCIPKPTAKATGSDA